jgi:hypothetical protein
MDFLSKLLPGQPAGADQQQQGGLLADWQAYSGQPGDVESGAAANTPANQLAKTAEDVGSSITGFLRTGYTAVSDGIGNIQTPSLENT